MGSENQKIIVYTADTSLYMQGLAEMKAANAKLAQSLESQIGSSARIVSQEIGKIKTVKIFDKEGEKTGKKYLQDIVTVAETGSGTFKKFATTYEYFNGVQKQVATTVTDVTSKYKDLASSQNSLIGQSSQLRTNFSSLTDINKKFAGNLKEVGDASRIVKQNISQFSDGAVRMGTIIQGTNGKFYQLTETIKRTPEGIQKVDRSVKEVSQSFAEGSKNTVSLGQNIARLASRAALTIPLWLALRGAVMGFIRGVSDGYKNLIEFDKALQKLKKNLQGTPEEIARNFEVAKKEITDFSIKTGKSTEDITKAIQRFATVGFDYATAMKAGIDATKLSIVLFGEAEDTANAFARGMRVLVTDVNNTKRSQQEIAGAFALTSELYETNAFELNELSGGLEKFAGTAKSLNFTTQETLTLLAALSTRGLNAQRAGTLLRTSTQKLEENLHKVSNVLGVEINPNMDRTYDVFVKVINAIAKLNKSTISPEVSEAIAELFGGVRSGEPVRDLIADIENVNIALNKFSKAKPDVAKFNAEFEEMNRETFQLQARLSNLGKEAWKAFIEGILGGKELNKTLRVLVNTLDDVQKSAKLLGKTLNVIGKLARLGIAPGSFIPNIGKDIAEVKTLKKEIKSALKGDKTAEEYQVLVTAVAEINKRKKKDIIPKEQVELLKTLMEQKLAEEMEADGITVDPQVKVKFEKKRVDLAELLLKYELDKQKALGVSNSELIKAEMHARKLLNIEGEMLDKKERQLQLEKAIAEEKRLQGKLGSDSIKLFRIAQEHGSDIARKIGDVLAGTVDFDTFIRMGGKAAKVFEKEFADLFEQKQAEKFFKGFKVTAGKGRKEQDLTGGASIKIQEDLTKSSNQIARNVQQQLSLSERSLEIEDSIYKLRARGLEDLKKDKEDKPTEPQKVIEDAKAKPVPEIEFKPYDRSEIEKEIKFKPYEYEEVFDKFGKKEIKEEVYKEKLPDPQKTMEIAKQTSSELEDLNKRISELNAKAGYDIYGATKYSDLDLQEYLKRGKEDYKSSPMTEWNNKIIEVLKLKDEERSLKSSQINIAVDIGDTNITTEHNIDKITNEINKKLEEAKKQTIEEVKNRLIGKQGGDF